MSGEIDCPWCDVHVHDPVDNLRLEVSLVLVDHVLLPGVEQLDEGEVGLVLLGDWLINFLVVFYPLKEVSDCLKTALKMKKHNYANSVLCRNEILKKLFLPTSSASTPL